MVLIGSIIPVEDADTNDGLTGLDLVPVFEFVAPNSPVVDEGAVLAVQILDQAKGWPNVQQEVVARDQTVRSRLQNEMGLGRSTDQKRVGFFKFKEPTGLRPLNNLESNPHI
jgi:hypothetical protein